MQTDYLVKYEEIKKQRKHMKILYKVKNRLKGGYAYKSVLFHYNYYKKHPTAKTKKSYICSVASYFLGSGIANIIFKMPEADRLCFKYYPKEGQTMYHFASEKDIHCIKKKGLISGGELKYVYMTDDAEYAANSGYFKWKVLRAQSDIKFVIIKIDAFRLASEYDIFSVSEEHEFAVKAVPAKYLEFIKESDN